MRRAILPLSAAACVVALALAAPAPAREITLNLPPPSRLVEDALVQQVFVGPVRTARVLQGRSACNALTPSAPRLESAGGSLLRILAILSSRGSTPLPQRRCLPLFEWTGVLEAGEVPIVQPGRFATGSRVDNSNLLAQDGGRRAVPDVLWSWVRDNVHRRLKSTLDLAPLRGAAVEAVAATMSGIAVPAIASLSVTRGVAAAGARETTFAFDVPEPPAGRTAPLPAPVLSIEELQRWRATWQAWDAFATWLVEEGSALGGEYVRRELADILLAARHDLALALAEDSHGDPVPALFVQTWKNPAPVLRKASRGLPAADALRLLGLISAADALRAINTAGPQYGFSADGDSLRRLARFLAPAVAEAALEHTVEVDPELRRLLGFEPVFSLTDAALRRPPWRWLMADAAAAAKIDPNLVQRLSGRVPSGADLDTDLGSMETPFVQVAQDERQRGRIKPAFAEVLAPVLRATAWRETCWRQFVTKSCKVQTIRSVRGSVGIMRVNTHVWNGVYDVNGLLGDVGSNARAGNETLVRYLVNYAIRRGEHKAPGGLNNHYRATYAVYNGGPGHLSRYRERSTRKSLRRIDAAFFAEFETIRREGRAAVKQCRGA